MTTRNATSKGQEGRYPALMTVLNRRREVFGLCDRELAERTQSRFGANKNVSQVYRILRGNSGTRQRYAEQLAQVVDVGRHVSRLLIEFDDELTPLEIPNEPATRAAADRVLAAYHRDEDMFALQGAVCLYEQSMGDTGPGGLLIRADMSLVIGKVVRLHGSHPGFIDDALRFVDDAVDVYLGLLDHPGVDSDAVDAQIVAAELERATIYRRRGHLEMARRTLNDCRTSQVAVFARNPSLDGKCWHGLGDLYEQKALIDDRNASGSRWADQARQAYERAVLAYSVAGKEQTRVDRHAIATDLAMLEIRAGAIDAALARLADVEADAPLAPTVEARLHNRRAWAYLKIGEPMRAQRFVKQAVRAATSAGDPLLMAMAEVLRYELYRELRLPKKAAMQYEQVLDWVYRDGIRHAEVLMPVAEYERDSTDGGRQLSWLLKVPWLNAMLTALLVVGALGCTTQDGVNHEAPGLHVVQRSLANSPVASDPKAPLLSDPKRPQTDGTLRPDGSDPKSPAGSDPKSPAGSDPKSPAGSDPKSPAGSDPKSPAGSDPKSPAGSDPKSPAGSDPKSPAGSDPKSPASSDPKAPVGGSAAKPSHCKASSDPKKPAATASTPAADTCPADDDDVETVA